MSKILCVLDGLGFSPGSKNNVLSLSKLPNIKSVLKDYYWYTLNADGDNVGQETGLVGNSEVGHMNIGGLKLIPQLSYQITKSSQEAFNLDKINFPDQLFDPKQFLIKRFEKFSKTVHLIGLFSTGTIHSDLRHWAGSIQAAGLAGATKIVLHIFSDGRDSDRQSLLATWKNFLIKFGDRLKPFENKLFLGSFGGRFYAMDRDKNWDRVASGSFSLFNPKVREALKSDKFKSFLEKHQVNLDELTKVVKHSIYATDTDLNNLQKITEVIDFYTKLSYEDDEFDEHIVPQQLFYGDQIGHENNYGIGTNDTVWLLNFRTDRMKQFCRFLCDLNKEFKLNLNILGMNDYCVEQEIYLDQNFDITRKKADIGYFPIFKNQPVKEPLAKFISEHNYTQLHIAETEKYSHVTYFLNGGQNMKWEGENWVVIDSNKVASHADKPEMKAKEITDYILENGLGKYDYIMVNYANPDMVGHTGDIEAGIKSMEFLDNQLGRLIKAVIDGGHELILIADHGNIEFVGGFEKNGKHLTDTEHNANAVPFIFVSKQFNPQNFVSNVENFLNQNNYPKMPNLKKVISLDNRITLNENQWLTKEVIPKPLLPLWIAGLALINL